MGGSVIIIRRKRFYSKVRVLTAPFVNPIIFFFSSSLQDRLGIGNNGGLDMRSIEHCLSDIMRGVDAASAMQDPMKGKCK